MQGNQNEFGFLNFNMAELATLVLLSELVDSDDEKPTRGPTRDWVKRRQNKGYFNNIIQELRIEDRLGFREIFERKFLISNLFWPK